MPPTRSPRNNAPKARKSRRVQLPIGETQDLFDTVRVTWPEVRLWVGTVAPHVLSSEQRFEYYVKGWDVPGKVRQAKMAGGWPPVSGSARQWH